MHRVKIVTGDPSCDGHGQHDTIEFMCNKSGIEISEMYALSVKLTNCDITNQCTGYGDSSLTSEYLKLAKATLGHFPEAKEILEESERCNYIDSDGFALLYLYTAKQVAPDLEFEVAPNDYSDEIEIGGYGLLGG